MKICQVHPACGLEVPPKSWGAIEKIVWEFHTNFKELGIESDIKFATEINAGDYDIVLCHVANLTDILKENNVPYIYQLHDHHVYHHGKDSHAYNVNKKAIDGSIISLVPARYLVDYFESPKVQYFSHGVNIDFFKPNLDIDHKKRFLMLANNGLGGETPGFDRKGFEYGLGLASMTGQSITIAGPSNNKNFFNENIYTLNYVGLTLKFDPSPEEVLKLYQSHDIFLHPSMLEAGHPNLTMLEAAACGMPIIANWEHGTDFHGAWRAPRDVFAMYEGYKIIQDDFKKYQNQALQTSRKLSWSNRSKELINLFNECTI
mgnify:FL=1